MPANEQGVDPNRYHVIPRCLVFIFSGLEVLLLKGSSTKKIWANKYNGIGGHIEQGEDPLSAAERELFEESGIENIQLHLAGVILVDSGGKIGISIYVFTGKWNESTLRNSAEGNLEWINLNRLEEYPVVEDLPQIIPLAYGVMSGKQPFSAKSWYNDEGKFHILIR